MARRRTDRPPANPHYWTQVVRHLVCWPRTTGAGADRHDVAPGKWMRFRKDDDRRMGECEDCLRARGIHRPTRSFTFSGDATRDTKARQVGDE